MDGVSSDIASLIRALLALAIAGTAVYALRHVAERLRLVDYPHSHKTHVQPTALVGGIGILLAALVLASITGEVLWHPAFWIGATLLVAVGIRDDQQGLSPTVRFVAQIAAALVMCLVGGVKLDDFGQLLWPGHVLALGLLSVPVTVFATVGVINAANMIDGLDGLCGGVALIALVAMAVLALSAGAYVETERLGWFIGATLGFLAFNVRIGERSARAFLGNSGSMLLGFVLAWNLVALSQGPARAFAPVTGLWLLALPLIDTVSVMWRRWSAGRSPVTADHQHLHHVLRRSGIGVERTVAILALVAAICAAIGVGLERLGVAEAARYGLFLVVAFGYHAVMVRVMRRLPPLPETAPSAPAGTILP